MENNLTSFEELKAFGIPLNSLTKDKDSGFQNLPAAKDILSPLKELVCPGSFDELSSLSPEFEPLKALSSKKDQKKDGKNDGNKDGKKDDKKDEGKDSKDENKKDDNKEAKRTDNQEAKRTDNRRDGSKEAKK